jgi:hypothetical protein
LGCTEVWGIESVSFSGRSILHLAWLPTSPLLLKRTCLEVNVQRLVRHRLIFLDYFCFIIGWNEVNF